MYLTDFKEKPYREYLQSQKLSSNIQHFVQHSIAMVTDETSTLEVSTVGGTLIIFLVGISQWIPVLRPFH